VASSLCLAQAAPATSTDTAKTDKKAAKKKSARWTPPPSLKPLRRRRQGVGEYFEQGLPQGRRPWYGKTKHGQYMTEADHQGCYSSQRRRDGQEDEMKKDEMKK